MAPRDDEELRQINSVLTDAAKHFDLENMHFTADADALFHVLERLGDIVGSDETGQRFKEGYGKAEKNAKSFVHAIEDAYKGITERLRLMTVSVDLANWSTMTALPKVPDNGPEFSAGDGTMTF
ncbi:hypothetical protein ACIBHX_18450 [Nonomuraea sp. NPDC050536]|uniref:hypothetical protein n=1 Tax=Nonomuraea sp. NPDC050536 TaxID=3364366 RepID=UPI0037C71FEF